MSGEESSKWFVKQRREAPATPDLFVCFPSRAHMSLISKPICSPGRTMDPSKRARSGTNKVSGLGSPMFRTKTKHHGPEIDEPTSPKVTCAGQVRVKPRTCKNWQSVMEEIERIHGKQKKSERPRRKNGGSSLSRGKFVGAFGFKKEVMQFLNALRNIRFDLRCFGSVPFSDDDSSDEEQGHEIEEEEELGEDQKGSRTIFSKWFMILQENQNNGLQRTECCSDRAKDLMQKVGENGENEEKSVVVPPPNALLLMRCRSAPAKGWLDGDGVEVGKICEEEKKESLVLMRCGHDLFNVSEDVAKETWVGRTDPFSRSRSWKR